MAPAQNGTPPPELIATLLRLRDSTQPNIDACYQLMVKNPATAPTEGSVLFDYPVARVSTAAEPSGTSAAADARSSTG